MRPFSTSILLSFLILLFSCEENQLKTHQKRLEDERNIRLNYIEEHNIPDSTKKDEGIYYIELEKGTGETSESGDWVLVYYTGYNLDGYIFDSNVLNGRYEPLIVELLTNENTNSAQGYRIRNASRSGTVVSGFAHALKYMKKDGRARVIIPSALGYGVTGGSGILPYSTIIFELEVVEIRKQ